MPFLFTAYSCRHRSAPDLYSCWNSMLHPIIYNRQEDEENGAGPMQAALCFAIRAVVGQTQILWIFCRHRRRGVKGRDRLTL